MEIGWTSQRIFAELTEIRLYSVSDWMESNGYEPVKIHFSRAVEFSVIVITAFNEEAFRNALALKRSGKTIFCDICGDIVHHEIVRETLKIADKVFCNSVELEEKVKQFNQNTVVIEDKELVAPPPPPPPPKVEVFRGKIYDGHNSHIPVLECIFNWKFKIDNIIEFGLGHHSTKFFLDKKIPLRSIETKLEWFNKIQFSSDCWEKICTQDELDDSLYKTNGITLCLVDSGDYLSRHRIATKALQNSTFVVVHDSEERLYQYKEIKINTKNFIEIRDFLPWSAVITNENPDFLLKSFSHVKVFNTSTLPFKEYLR